MSFSSITEFFYQNDKLNRVSEIYTYLTECQRLAETPCEGVYCSVHHIVPPSFASDLTELPENILRCQPKEKSKLQELLVSAVADHPEFLARVRYPG